MALFSKCLKHLIEGRHICSVRYPQEFALMEQPDTQTKIDKWLNEIDYRLARLRNEGAFFMTHKTVTVELRAQVSKDLRLVRSKLERVIGFIQTLRLANQPIYPGEVIFETQIFEEVRKSTHLERRLQEMRDITGARITDSSQDRLSRMLGILQSEGYIIESNPTLKSYTFTGKIDYLYQMIGFIVDNSPAMAEDSIVDQIDASAQLALDADRRDSLETLETLNEQGERRDPE